MSVDDGQAHAARNQIGGGSRKLMAYTVAYFAIDVGMNARDLVAADEDVDEETLLGR